jgi:hypothetical protein
MRVIFACKDEKVMIRLGCEDAVVLINKTCDRSKISILITHHGTQFARAQPYLLNLLTFTIFI